MKVGRPMRLALDRPLDAGLRLGDVQTTILIARRILPRVRRRVATWPFPAAGTKDTLHPISAIDRINSFPWHWQGAGERALTDLLMVCSAEAGSMAFRLGEGSLDGLHQGW